MNLYGIYSIIFVLSYKLSIPLFVNLKQGFVLEI